jgi:hypothetical protein
MICQAEADSAFGSGRRLRRRGPFSLLTIIVARLAVPKRRRRRASYVATIKLSLGGRSGWCRVPLQRPDPRFNLRHCHLVVRHVQDALFCVQERIGNAHPIQIQASVVAQAVRLLPFVEPLRGCQSEQIFCSQLIDVRGAISSGVPGPGKSRQNEVLVPDTGEATKPIDY